MPWGQVEKDRAVPGVGEVSGGRLPRGADALRPGKIGF